MLHLLFLRLFLLASITILALTAGAQACPPPAKHLSTVERLNSEGQAEAYPHLSADGLRLYFTAQRDSGLGKIYFAQRETLADDFTNCRLLSSNFFGNYIAASLTADEQTIYLTTYEGIFVSHRKDGGDFSQPEEVKELSRGFPVAVAPDGKEIMARHNNQYIHYRLESDGKFKRAQAIPVRDGDRVMPGQFNKDGLSFYMTTKRKKGVDIPGDSSFLLKFTRATLQDSFARYEIIRSEDNPPFLSQVTVNEDESILVGVRSASLWQENDLTCIRLKEPDPRILLTETNRIDTLKLEVIQFTINRRGDSSGLADIDFVLRLINTTALPVLLPVNENLFGLSSQASELCMAVPEGEPELRFSCPSRKMRISVAKRTLAPGESIMFKKQHTMGMDPAREYSIHLQCRPIESRIYAEAKWQIVPENYFL